MMKTSFIAVAVLMAAVTVIAAPKDGLSPFESQATLTPENPPCRYEGFGLP